MKKNDRYTSLIYVAFGFYIAFEGYRLNFGNFNNPGSGFFVFLAGITLSSISIALFILTFFSKEEKEKIIWREIQWTKGIKLMAYLFAFTFVFRWMGFLLSTFVLLLFLYKSGEPKRWRGPIVLSVISILVCYLLFGVLLETQFPEGILEKIISRLQK